MIWTPPPRPSVGDARVVRRFAWWPVTLIDGNRLWLERYYALEQRRQDYDTFSETHYWHTEARATFDLTPHLLAARTPTPEDTTNG